jgi:hypothetical protein
MSRKSAVNIKYPSLCLGAGGASRKMSGPSVA